MQRVLSWTWLIPVVGLLAYSLGALVGERPLSVEETGELRGSLKRCGPGPAITLFVPGHSVQAHPGTGGRFRLHFVPEGRHALMMESSGHARVLRPDVQVEAGEVTDLGVVSLCTDADEDGTDTASDCDDRDPNTHPLVAERCDGRDNNCNGVMDEGFELSTDPENCGACGRSCGPHGTCLGGICVAPDNDDDGTDAITDCDDSRADVAPEATELCDGVDNDCNGLVDEEDDICPGGYECRRGACRRARR